MAYYICSSRILGENLVSNVIRVTECKIRNFCTFLLSDSFLLRYEGSKSWIIISAATLILVKSMYFTVMRLVLCILIFHIWLTRITSLQLAPDWRNPMTYIILDTYPLTRDEIIQHYTTGGVLACFNSCEKLCILNPIFCKSLD